jgi:hypothetical protein
VIGLVAVAGLAPRLFAKTPATPALIQSNGPAAKANPPVAFRPDARAVARQDGAV